MSTEDDPKPALIIVEMSTDRIGELPTQAQRQAVATSCARLAFSDFFNMVIDCRRIPGPALIPELRGSPNVQVLAKQNGSSCYDAAGQLAALLKKHGISHLCVCGMDTEASVLQTVRDCQGLEIYVVQDAVATPRGDDVHRQALNQMSTLYGPEVLVEVDDLLGEGDDDEEEIIDDDQSYEEIVESEEDYTEIEIEETINDEEGDIEDDNASCDNASCGFDDMSMAPTILPTTVDEEAAMARALARATEQSNLEEKARQLEFARRAEANNGSIGKFDPATLAPIPSPALVRSPSPIRPPPIRATNKSTALTPALAPALAPALDPVPTPAPDTPQETAPTAVTAAPTQTSAPLNLPSSPGKSNPGMNSTINSSGSVSIDENDPYAKVKAEAAKTKGRAFRPKIKKFRAPWAKRTTTSSYASVDGDEKQEKQSPSESAPAPSKSPIKSPKALVKAIKSSATTPKSPVRAPAPAPKSPVSALALEITLEPTPAPTPAFSSPVKAPTSPNKTFRSPGRSPRSIPIPVNASSNSGADPLASNKSIVSPTPVSETIKKFRVPANRTAQPPWVVPQSKPSPAASGAYNSTGWQKNHLSDRVSGRINDLKQKGIMPVAAPQQRMKTPKIVTDVREVWDKHDNLTRTTIRYITEIDGTKREERSVEYIKAGDPGNPIP